MPDAVSALLHWLRARHAAIMDCEKKALAALYDEKDEQGYRSLMLRKGELVAGLEEEQGAALVQALPPSLREDTADTLSRFAASARTGLKIGSVFYMSALLYPDEHKEGEPDNLLRFIRQLERN